MCLTIQPQVLTGSLSDHAKVILESLIFTLRSTEINQTLQDRNKHQLQKS